MIKYKDNGVEWIGQIPEDWSVIRLKDKYQSIKEIVGEKANEFERLALTLQGVIKRDKYDENGLQPEKFDGYQIIRKNDFVFKMIDLQNISTSRVGLVPFDGIVSPAYLRFRPRNKQKNKFLYYYLLSLWQNEVFNSLGGDGVRSSLTAENMGILSCPFPKYETQQKIVNILDKKCAQIDELIKLQEQEIEKLKEYKQSVITEVVTKGLDKNAKMKDSGIEWIGQIPENWELKKLKYAYKNRDKKCTDGLFKYVALENIESKSGEYIETETNQYYSLEGTILAYKNDVVFGKLRPYLAKSIVINENCCVSSEFAVFYSNINNTEFLHNLFLSYNIVDIINSSTYGTKMPRANIEFIKNLKIAIPSLEIQNNIVNYLRKIKIKINSLISIKQNKILKLQDYKKSLIYEYVTGKKEIK